MRPEGRVQVVVRSRRVPIGTISHVEPIYSMSGVQLGSVPSRLVLYGTSLDEEHQHAIDEAQKLACNLGLGLEVVDESRSGLLGRFMSRIGLSDSRSPTVVVSPAPTAVSPDPSPVAGYGC